MTAEADFLITTINAIADPIFVKNENHQWIFVNDAFCRLLGRNREEIIGKSDYDFLPKDQADIFWEKDSIVLKTGEVNINQEEIRFGTYNRVILTTKSRFYTTDKRVCLVGLIHDISKRIQTETALLLKQKEIEEANLALKNVLASFEQDRHRIREDVAANIEREVKPLLESIKRRKRFDKQLLTQLEDRIANLSSDYYRRLINLKYGLTATEIRICRLVLEGNSSKRIAEKMSVTMHTVNEHKSNIRRKLGLVNSSINLRTFLSEMS